MKKIIAIRQRDLTDCGATCLCTILYYYGCSVSIGQIRQYAGTDQRGTNVLGLIEAGERMGLSARGARGNKESLRRIPLPAIAHLVLPSGLHHYVVLSSVKKRFLQYMDPGQGQLVKESIESFCTKWSGVVVMFAPQPGFERVQRIITVPARFFKLVRPHTSDIMQAIMGAVIYTLLGFSTSFYVQKIIDDVIGNGNNRLLHLLGVIMVLLLVMQVLIGAIRSIILLKTGQVMDARLITGYYRHLFHLPSQFFDTMRVGEIMSRFGDAIKIRVFLNDVSMNMLVNLLVVLFSSLIMFLFYWKLALLILAIIPIYLLLYYLNNKINKSYQRRIMEQAADLESTLIEGIQNVSSIKRLSLEKYMVSKTETVLYQLLKTGYSAGQFNLGMGVVTEFFQKGLVIGILWLGSGFVLQRVLSLGELLGFYSLIGYFTAPVSYLIGSGKSMQDAIIAAERLFEIIDMESEKAEAVPKANLTNDSFGDITFSGVTFRYGTRKCIFNELDLTIKKGEITAIVGESGSGKSTIISLLINLYPLKKGRIYIGDHDIEHLSLESLRSSIGVVPQNIDLFNGTIIDNVAIGDQEPDIAKVIRVCKLTGADHFIEALPCQYRSNIGEKGVTLSGGQKQMIGIARALYRDPQLLVFDESTANLDPISEERIRKLIADLKAMGKTVVLISHKLSTIRCADTLHFIRNGKVAASGQHASLMEGGGEYSNLWSSAN